MSKTLSEETNKLFWCKLVIILLPFILYANTLSHDYALDDAIVITHNQFTQKGVSGIIDIFANDSFAGFNKDSKSILSGGRYRPLSIATFAIENGIWGNKPHLSHLINILLYILTGLLLFSTLRMLFKSNHQSYFSIPFIATLIFLVHPIHTEVVANIKGRDEIVSLLFSLLALMSTLHFVEKKKWYWMGLAFTSLFLGLLSKENAVSFALIIPLSIYFFRNEKKSTLINTSIPVLAAVFMYFMVRHLVIGNFEINANGGLMNNPFQDADFNQKYSTIFLTLGMYIKLLIWPHPLTYDYYPYHISLVTFSNAFVILSLLIYIAIFVYAIMKLKTRNIVAFSILFFLIALFPVSNLIVGVGVFMSERFIYQPSIGFSIAAAYLIISAPKVNFIKFFNKPAPRIIVLSTILLTFSILTFSRNSAWKNNYTLFLTDVETSQNSAKGNYAAGKILLDSAYVSNDLQKRHEQLAKSIQYLSRAIEIDPSFTDVWMNLGTAQFEYDHDVSKAFQFYLKGLESTPGNEMLYKNIHFILSKSDDPNIKIELYNRLLEKNPNRADVYTQLGFVYGKEKKDIATSINQFKKSISINPSYFEAYKGLGTAYLLSQNYEEAFANFEKYLTYNNNDAGIYRLMATAVKMKGNDSLAEDYLAKANKLSAK